MSKEASADRALERGGPRMNLRCREGVMAIALSEKQCRIAERYKIP